jgi:hypothetical protein
VAPILISEGGRLDVFVLAQAASAAISCPICRLISRAVTFSVLASGQTGAPAVDKHFCGRLNFMDLACQTVLEVKLFHFFPLLEFNQIFSLIQNLSKPFSKQNKTTVLKKNFSRDQLFFINSLQWKDFSNLRFKHIKNL